MKIFTVEEANETLCVVRPMLLEIQEYHLRLGSYRESAKSAAESARLGGGGMEGGSHYVKMLYELGKLTLELDALGVQLKDYARGLIDFPSMRDGRVVLLCWQLGEGAEIEWWHDLETGFAGRKPI